MKRPNCLALVASLFVSAVQGQEKEPRKEFTNSVGIKFVWIRPGSFMMGSPKEENARVLNETQHKVTLTKAFYLGVYPVTQGQWRAVMGNNPSRFRGEKNLPVEQVSWVDCQEFLCKMGANDGRAYRLPTEAEWEYACRAGTTTPFYFGAMISTDRANYNGNTTYGEGLNGTYRRKTTPVGSFLPNEWSLYDMHGNVWQWCVDIYEEYSQSAVVDPQRPSQMLARISEFVLQLGSPKFAERSAATKALSDIGVTALPALRKMIADARDLETCRRAQLLVAVITDSAKLRVLRGGSFASPADVLRSAYRYRLDPVECYDLAGFRAVSFQPE